MTVVYMLLSLIVYTYFVTLDLRSRLLVTRTMDCGRVNGQGNQTKENRSGKGSTIKPAKNSGCIQINLQ